MEFSQLKAPVRYSVAILMMLLATSSVLAQSTNQSTPEAVMPQPSIAFYASDDDQSGAISVELNPGEEASVPIMLGNSGEIEFDAITYAADGYTLRNGGFGLQNSEADQTGPTLWLDYPTEQITTVPGEGTERDLKISVPEGTSPGEYVTGIAMETADSVNDDFEEDDGTYRLNMYFRSVIGIRILVPGELSPSIELGEPVFVVEAAVPGIIIPVSNTGNVRAVPSGEVRLSDAEGNIIFSAPIQMGIVYGFHETEIWIGLSEPLPQGDYQISVKLDDEDADVHVELGPSPLVVEESYEQSLGEESPIRFTTTSAEPLPAADSVQFLAVDATITNTTEEPVVNAQLSLIANVDGEEVERFPISQSLALPPGNSDVSSRYIPLTGWTSGEWEFELLLETVDGSGTAVVVDRVPIDTKVTVP